MSRALVVFVLMLIPAAAQDYWHRASLSFGGLIPSAGHETESFDSAPLLSFDYGFRFNRYGQFDMGVDAAFATERRRSEADVRRNIYIPRVGYSVVVPVWRDRIEASFGGGGAYSFFKPNNGNESWLIYLQGRGNYAIDRDKRFRAGMVVRWYRDPIGTPVQQWTSVAVEATYAFGR
jgi:hypothetical protein